MQLHLCLTSIYEQFKSEVNIKVQYVSTDDNFQKGYEQLKQCWLDVDFVKETDFKSTLFEIINHYKNKYCLFFTDDDVFVKPVTVKEYSEMITIFEGNDKIHCLSLRMNPNINYCNPAKLKINPPNEFVEKEKYLLWYWTRPELAYHYCWAYPMAINSHIYEMERLVKLINILDFTNVNELESRLNGKRYLDKPLILSFLETKVFNVQNNFVQGTRTGEVEHENSVESLNEKFLNGEFISTENIYGMKPTQAHGPIEYKFQ